MTIRDSLKFPNKNDLPLLANIDLYEEKELSTSTDVIEANFKKITLSIFNSSVISDFDTSLPFKIIDTTF